MVTARRATLELSARLDQPVQLARTVVKAWSARLVLLARPVARVFKA